MLMARLDSAGQPLEEPGDAARGSPDAWADFEERDAGLS